MSWTAASQLKASAQHTTIDHSVEEEFVHNKVIKLEPRCDSLARINLWIPTTEACHVEERQLGAARVHSVLNRR